MMFSSDPTLWLKDLFLNAGLSYSLSSFMSTVAAVIIIFILSWLANIIAKAVILQVVTRIVKKSKNQWDDVFLEQKVFTRMSHFAPALIIWILSGWALKSSTGLLVFVHNLTYIYMLCIGMIVMNSFIDSWHHIYQTLPIAKHRNIKGYVQLVKIFVILVTLLFIISVVFKRDVMALLTGLGVMASVLILVFKDTLLGLVASIQLSANKMLKVGDWITIPGRDVDGTVTDISLNTVKVQNFDKTIYTVPTYALVQDSFQNWIGMEEAGARRIKRPIFIDMKSIKFLDTPLREKLNKIPELRDFIEKSENIDAMRTQNVSDNSNPFFAYNSVTNLGLFRFYGETWLKNHPKAAKDQSIMLRHRMPEGKGLPLEIYVFSNDKNLVGFETFQNEIFEHLLAIISEFDLKVFQEPTGHDVLELSATKRIN